MEEKDIYLRHMHFTGHKRLHKGRKTQINSQTCAFLCQAMESQQLCGDCHMLRSRR